MLERDELGLQLVRGEDQVAEPLDRDVETGGDRYRQPRYGDRRSRARLGRIRLASIGVAELKDDVIRSSSETAAVRKNREIGTVHVEQDSHPTHYLHKESTGMAPHVRTQRASYEECLGIVVRGSAASLGCELLPWP